MSNVPRFGALCITRRDYNRMRDALRTDVGVRRLPRGCSGEFPKLKQIYDNIISF